MVIPGCSLRLSPLAGTSTTPSVPGRNSLSQTFKLLELAVNPAKILQARLQQYVNHELPDVQAGFRKGRGTRDQIANIL